MKAVVNMFWYRAEFFLGLEMFQTKYVEKIKVYMLCSNLAFSGMKKERFLDPRGHRWQYAPWELHAR